MSECQRKCGEPYTMTIRKRIQEQAPKEEQPPGLAHSPPGGHQPYDETEYDKKDNLWEKENRT
eukprot:240442-Amphidinium_carterae.1